MHIAVAGGTGVVGRQIANKARARGHQVSLLTRSVGVDLLRDNPEELAKRLNGVDVVVDTTNVAAIKKSAAETFFGTVTRNLLAAEESTGVRHHVCLSIVGIDAIGFGYHQGKVLQERLVQASTVPWTILRATQFHEFADQTLARGALGPVYMVPRMLSQPIAAAEVASAVVDLAEGRAFGRTQDLAGPEPLEMVDMVRELARRRGIRKAILGLRIPGAAAKAMRTGALLPSSDGPRAEMTFREWLACDAARQKS